MGGGKRKRTESYYGNRRENCDHVDRRPLLLLLLLLLGQIDCFRVEKKIKKTSPDPVNRGSCVRAVYSRVRKKKYTKTTRTK